MKIRKIFVTVALLGLLPGLFLMFRPSPVRGGFAITFDIPTNIYEFIVKPIVRRIANSMANRLADKVYQQVNGKNNGPNALPHFVLSWRNNLLESVGRGTDTFRSLQKGVQWCPHFKDNLLDAFGSAGYPALTGNTNFAGEFGTLLNAPGSDPFDYVNKCTLGGVNIDQFKADFTNGGWDAWNKLIEPQNNFYGAFINSLDQQTQQEGQEAQANDNQLKSKGFLPNREDIKKGDRGGPEGCVLGSTGTGGRCIIYGKVLTPADVFGTATAKQIDAKLDSYYSAQDLTDIVGVLFAAITRGVLGRLTSLLPANATALFGDAVFDSAQGDAQANANLRQCTNSCIIFESGMCNSIPDEISRNQCQINVNPTCNTRCQSSPPAANPQ